MRRIYAREEYCIGCRLCEVHCALRRSRTGDILKAFTRENPKPKPGIVVEEDGPVSFASQCGSCEEPACLYACISGAIHRNREGALVYDARKCVGCWTCVAVCPYGVIRRSEESSPKAVRCDMCSDLEVPVCVANCPNEALVLEEDAS